MPTRRIVSIGIFVVVFAFVWESAKWLAGDPWRLTALGYEHHPPFHIAQLNDLNLPHLWSIVAAFFEPYQRPPATRPGYSTCFGWAPLCTPCVRRSSASCWGPG